MKRATGRLPIDLTIVAGLTALGVCIAIAGGGGPLAFLILLPLVLILPGYALTAALFRPDSIGLDLRLLLTPVLSIATVALGGLALQIFFDLTRDVFVALLAIVTLTAVGVAGRRRRGRPSPRSVTLPGYLPLVAAALAVALTGAAVALATSGEQHQIQSVHFSSLWLLPEPASDNEDASVIIGASNDEGHTRSYRLRLVNAGAEVANWRFRLADESEWQRRLPATSLGGVGRLSAVLFVAGVPDRRVAINLPAQKATPADG